MSHSTSHETRTAPVYIVFDAELWIDAPVSRVWKYAIDYPSWQNYSIVQPISGAPGQEGEVVLLKKEEAGVVSPPFYARTIKIDPQRRVIWKTYRDTPDYFGIVEFTFQEVNGRTRFCHHVLYEYLRSYRDERELEDFRAERYRVSAAVFAAVFPKLKKLAEEA